MEEEKDIIATLTYKLPYHAYEYKAAANAGDYLILLENIYQKCRSVWKYEENPSDDRQKLAEEIAEMIGEANLPH